MRDATREAAGLGFEVTTDAQLPIDPDAVRMLPADAPALAVAHAGGVLSIVTDHVPSAAECTAYEKASGCAVTITVASPDTYATLRTRASAAGAAATRALSSVLAAVDDDADTVHLVPGAAPTVRTRGEIATLPGWPALSVGDVLDAVTFVTGRDPSGGTGPDSERVVSWAGTRWRCVVYTASGNPHVVLHRIPATVPRLEQLGLPASATDTVDLTDGLVLITGPAGAGKSTTLAALLDKINATRRVWISTVEQPVEHTLPSRHALVTQRSVGTDTPSVADAVATAVAGGVDVLAVTAPLRNRADTDAILRAAGGGALVYLAMPAGTVRSALAALLCTAPDDERRQVSAAVAEVFRAGIAQQLLPARDGSQIPAVEVAWAHPALTAVLRADRLAEFDAAAAGDPAGRSVPMTQAVESLISSGRVSDRAAASWRAAHPNPAGLLAGYLTGNDSDSGTDDVHDDVPPPADPKTRTRSGRTSRSRSPRGRRDPVTPVASRPAALVTSTSTAAPTPAAGRPSPQPVGDPTGGMLTPPSGAGGMLSPGGPAGPADPHSSGARKPAPPRPGITITPQS